MVVVLVVVTTLACVGSGYLLAEAQQPLELPPPALSKYEQQIIEYDRAAIVSAYKEQIHHLFLTWAKDDRDQPRRATIGARRARLMFERSMLALEERERLYRGR
jgi:hypothetical protein